MIFGTVAKRSYDNYSCYRWSDVILAAPGLINRYARTLLSSAVARGVPLDAICDPLGLELEQVTSDVMLFDGKMYAAVQNQVVQTLQDEFCGLTRSTCKPGTQALMCELVLSAESLEEALLKAFRLYRVVTDDVHFTLHREDSTARLVVHTQGVQPQRLHTVVEGWILFWLHFSSWLLGREIPLTRVSFEHTQSAFIEDYAQVFSPHCEFRSNINSVYFESRYLAQPVVKTVAQLEEFFDATRFEFETPRGVEPCLSSRVRRRLRHYFFKCQEFLTMDQLADECHVGSQTLRRRLESEGTSYRGLKEDIRREAAMIWLRDVEIPIVEVSRMSGFAEANGLSRAVKSWVGVSPSEFRRTIVASRQQFQKI